MGFGSNGPSDHWPEFGPVLDALTMPVLVVLLAATALLVAVLVVRKVDSNHQHDAARQELHNRIRGIVANYHSGVVSIEYIANQLSRSLAETVDLLNRDLPAGLSVVDVQLPDSRCPVAIALTIQRVFIPTARMAQVDAYVVKR